MSEHTGVLDLAIFEAFGAIFAIILIFVIVYGLLSISKILGERDGLYALIAFAIAILSLVNPGILVLVGFLAPWFFMLVFLAFFVLFILMIFGLQREDLRGWDTSSGGPLQTWVIIITILIFALGLGVAFGNDALQFTQENQTQPVNETGEPPRDVASGDFFSNVVATLINPSVAGLLAVMLIGVFSSYLLARNNVY